jgi:hypothetical protein
MTFLLEGLTDQDYGQEDEFNHLWVRLRRGHRYTHFFSVPATAAATVFVGTSLKYVYTGRAGERNNYSAFSENSCVKLKF